MARLIITANSPGEIAWARALALEANNRGQQVEILLLPCTFATGQEASVASGFPGVSAVHPTSSYLPLLLWRGRDWGPDVRILHLGGDLMYTAFLAWRWGWRCWSYLWGRPWWDSAFEGYFTKDLGGIEWMRRRRMPLHKVEIVGDLVVDTVREAAGSRQGRPLVVIMPGSRQIEVRFMTPFFLELADNLRAEFPELEFALLLSPFRQNDERSKILGGTAYPDFSGVTGRLLEQAGVNYLESPSGTRLRLVEHDTLSWLAQAKLAITIPGTKTGQAGALGIPTVMILPLNSPENLPMIGLIGLLDWLPYGRSIKGALIRRMSKNVGLLAQPNQRAGREITPELVGYLTQQMVTAKCLELLRDPKLLQGIAQELQATYEPLSGAAAKMLDRVLGD